MPCHDTGEIIPGTRILDPGIASEPRYSTAQKIIRISGCNDRTVYCLPVDLLLREPGPFIFRRGAVPVNAVGIITYPKTPPPVCNNIIQLSGRLHRVRFEYEETTVDILGRDLGDLGDDWAALVIGIDPHVGGPTCCHQPAADNNRLLAHGLRSRPDYWKIGYVHVHLLCQFAHQRFHPGIIHTRTHVDYQRKSSFETGCLSNFLEETLERFSCILLCRFRGEKSVLCVRLGRTSGGKHQYILLG